MFGIDFIAMVGGGALDGILSDDMISGLGDMVGGLAVSFIGGSGSGIGDNNATLNWSLTVRNTDISAYVTRYNGNKNDLTITVIDEMSDGSLNTYLKTFKINNNAADTYKVGPYSVYVNTKGNDQIRDCYIVK